VDQLMTVEMQGLFYFKAAVRSLVVLAGVFRLVEVRQRWARGGQFVFCLVKAMLRLLVTYISLPPMLELMAPAAVCT